MKPIYIVLIGLFCVAGVNVKSQTVTVRGKLISVVGNDTLSAASVAVTLKDSLDSRTIPVYTGSDGIYMIQEVKPRKYVLEIWAKGLKQDPTRYKIQVRDLNGTHFFDIAPIAIKKESK